VDPVRDGDAPALGVPASEISMVWPNKSVTIGDLTVRATFAIPLGGDDLTHVGYLFSVKDGPTVYFTGDTGYHEVLGDAIGPAQTSTCW
jgi:L-ascorbate 6-phosphate lactonase